MTALGPRILRRLRSEWCNAIRLLALIGWRRVPGSPVRRGVVVRPKRRGDL